MISDVDGFASKSTAELRDIRNSNVVEGPQHVLVESNWSLRQSNFDIVREQVVLAYEVLFLNSRVELGVVLFEHQHKKKPVSPGLHFSA